MRTTVATLALLFVGAAPASAAEGTTLGIPDPWWKLVNLAVFLFALIWFVGRPLGRFLEDRRTGIRAALEEAREKTARAEGLHAEVEERLRRVEAEIGELQARAEREAGAEAKRIRAEAESEEKRFLERVESEIERRSEETRLRLAHETAELTAQMARELLAREITDEDRKRLLQKSVAAVRALEEKG